MNRACEEIFKYKDSNEVAIVDSEKNYITYSELYNSCVSLAFNLEKRSSSKKVVIYTGNAIEYAIGLFALWMTDRTAVLVEVKAKQKEINDILVRFESDTVIKSHLTHTDHVNCENIIMPVQLSQLQPIWIDKPFTNNIAVIFQTSGTTQQAKFVMLTHIGIIEECNGIANAHGFGKGVRELIVVPITSSFGTCGELVPNLYVGGSVSLYQGDFNTAKLRRMIKDTKTTIVACTSSILALLINSDHSEVKDFSSVRYIISAGEVSNVSIFDRAKRVLGAENIVQAYGLTETSSQIAGSCVDKKAPYESVGRIMKNFTVRIKDGSEIRGANELGEIQVKGHAVTCGYYENNELNKKSYEDGWFRTGDIGYIDDKGYLYIKGRIKNIIIIGGKNVYAEEVENILTKNNNIMSAYVYGQKSNITGEKIVCDIVLKKDCCMTQTELNKYCKINMKSYMIPKEFKFITNQKINTSGKASRSVKIV